MLTDKMTWDDVDVEWLEIDSKSPCCHATYELVIVRHGTFGEDFQLLGTTGIRWCEGRPEPSYVIANGKLWVCQDDVRSFEFPMGKNFVGMEGYALLGLDSLMEMDLPSKLVIAACKGIDNGKTMVVIDGKYIYRIDDNGVKKTHFTVDVSSAGFVVSDTEVTVTTPGRVDTWMISKI